MNKVKKWLIKEVEKLLFFPSKNANDMTDNYYSSQSSAEDWTRQGHTQTF